MRIREMRKKAREALKGRWWQVIPITLFIQILGLILGFGFSYLSTLASDNTAINIIISVGALIGYIVYIAFVCVLSYVFVGKTIKFNRGEDITFGNYLKTLPSNIGRALKVTIFNIGYILKRIWMFLVLLVLSIVVAACFNNNETIVLITGIIFLISYIIAIVKGVIASFDYSLIYFLSNDYQDRQLKELFNKSKELMYGNRAKFLILPVTLIGWYILSMVPLYAGSIAINIIWTPISYFGQTFLTAPTWIIIVSQFLVLFTAPVIVYILLTTTNFYEAFNPQEIFSEEYVKPEINSKKYVIVSSIIIGLPILLYIVLALVIAFSMV